MAKHIFYTILALVCLCGAPATCQQQLSDNIWGQPGALLTPIALQRLHGELTCTYGRIPVLYAPNLKPHTRDLYSVTLTYLTGISFHIAVVRPHNYPGGVGDRTMGLHFQIMPEKYFVPAIAFGFQDAFAIQDVEPEQSQHFAALYGVASKTVSAPLVRKMVLSIGYAGDGLPAAEYALLGVFGSVIGTFGHGFSVKAEYDGRAYAYGLMYSNRYVSLSAAQWRFKEYLFNVTFAFNLFMKRDE